jgi:hypothetical protein
MKRTKPLIDTAIYTTVCAGVRTFHERQIDAVSAGNALLEEWAALGYRRTVRVYFRDGSLVAELTVTA